MFIFIDVVPVKKIMKQLSGSCPCCNRAGHLTLLTVSQCLRIFFIPIWHWHTRYYVVDAARSEERRVGKEC